ncbi:alpha/beta fold hydrolase [Microbacterium sp. NPDC090003]|uniref:alpha/beta fold hydrolase n=1 Tax=Microbacterium sp. NPDC090003 TaxID=3364203 RepID=UPI003803E911
MDTLDRRLARPGAVIAFADGGGDGRPVLLVHGAGMDHTMFDAQAEALTAAGLRVLRSDLRGHGASALDEGVRFSAREALGDITALLAECRIARAVIVGHSLGGNLAQAYAAAQPARVSGVVVMDASWNAGPLSHAERFALRLAAPTLALVPSRRLPGIMARASAVTAGAIARTEEMFARTPKSVFLDVWRATASLIAPEPGYRSPVPLGLIRGAEDRTGNIAAAMPRWAEAEGVDERVVPDAGHILTWDAPDETSTALLEILAEESFVTAMR